MSRRISRGVFMRVSLIKNGKIYNTNLPLKINGSFWIEDKDKNNLKRNLINIEAKEEKWQLKSNGNVNIIDGTNLLDSVILENYSGPKSKGLILFSL